MKGVWDHYALCKQICILSEDLKGTIKRSVAESTAERIVVVTHHLPTMAVVSPEHKGNLLNSAFATELGDFIADSRIDAWIFGHSHTDIDATIGNTRMSAISLAMSITVKISVVSMAGGLVRYNKSKHPSNYKLGCL